MESLEKVVIPETKRQIVEIEYSGVKIEVKPFISFSDEQTLILGYVAQYFSPTIDENNPKWNDVISQLIGRNIWNSEYFLKQRVLELVTNVDVEKLSPEDTVGLYNEVVKSIDNFYEFRNRLDETVYDVKDYLDNRASVGGVIDATVNKISEMVESLKGLNPEVMAELGKTLLNQMQESPIASVFVEAKKR